MTIATFRKRTTAARFTSTGSEVVRVTAANRHADIVRCITAAGTKASITNTMTRIATAAAIKATIMEAITNTKFEMDGRMKSAAHHPVHGRFLIRSQPLSDAERT